LLSPNTAHLVQQRQRRAATSGFARDRGNSWRRLSRVQSGEIPESGTEIRETCTESRQTQCAISETPWGIAMSSRSSVGCPGLKVAEHRFPEGRLPSCLTGWDRTAAHAEHSRATHSPAASATAEPCGPWHAPQIPQETVAVVFVPETSEWPALEPAACGAPAPAPGPESGRGHAAGGRPHASHRAGTPRASACGAAPSASSRQSPVGSEASALCIALLVRDEGRDVSG